MIDQPSQLESSTSTRETKTRHPQTFSRSLSAWIPLSVLVPAFMLWFEAILVRASADTPGNVAPAAAIAGTIGLFLCLPALSKPIWFRLLLVLLGLLFICRLAFYPPEALERGFVVVPRSLTITLAEFLLGCQVLVLWRWRSHDPLPIAFPCLALVTSIFALNNTLPMGTQSVYVFLVTVAILLPALMAASHPHATHPHQPRLPWGARIVLTVVCASVLLGTWTISVAWSRWLPDAQTWFATQVGRTLQDRQRLRDYTISGSLTSIRNEMSVDPNRIALRVYSDERPGYLTGRVFDQYGRGQWRIASDINRFQNQGARDERRILQPLTVVSDALRSTAHSLATFQLNSLEDLDTARRMTIQNDPRRGRVFFTPLAWSYIQGSGALLTVDEHDVIRFGISPRKPYLALADAASPKRPLSLQRRRQLLAPLSGLGPDVTALANEICRRTNTPQDKIRAVRSFFRDNFEYALKPIPVPVGTDPLTHFLLTRHPAHCEFFASGTVALLRLQGIPARYATGFRVMDLEEENGDYWIARNRNAHAWAEAYDQQQQRWVVVESTPGFTDPTDGDMSDVEADANSGQSSALTFTAGNASAIVAWWQSLPAPLRYTLSALSMAAIGLITFLIIRRVRRSRFAVAPYWNDPQHRQAQRLLRRMDRRLKRRGLIRTRAETLHQFANRIRAVNDAADAWADASADWYLVYAAARFGAAGVLPPALPRN